MCNVHVMVKILFLEKQEFNTKVSFLIMSAPCIME